MVCQNPQLTAVILTKDEERNIRCCLQGVPDNFPVVVLDSGSRDRTCTIAEDYGATVYHHQWMGFAEQRNYALTCCGISSPWVLFIDADERYSSEFFSFFEKSLASRCDFEIGMLPSQLVFKGRILRHAPGYPIYHPRLVRTAAGRFKQNHEGHGEAPDVALDRVIYFKDIPPYLHYFYDGDIGPWLHKHIELASACSRRVPDASESVHLTCRGRMSLWLAGSFWAAPIRFFYHYIIQGGFRDGRAGLEYSLMYAWYEATKWLLRICQSK